MTNSVARRGWPCVVFPVENEAPTQRSSPSSSRSSTSWNLPRPSPTPVHEHRAGDPPQPASQHDGPRRADGASYRWHPPAAAKLVGRVQDMERLWPWVMLPGEYL